MKTMVLGLVFWLLLGGVCGAGEGTPGVSVAPIAPLGQQKEKTVPRYVIYYFHNHIRCEDCLSMESMAVETVNYDFMPQVDKGLLVMRTVDVQDSGNEHFVSQFKLDGPTLILVEQNTKGKLIRWKNLDQIWELVRTPQAYEDYVRREITAFTGETGDKS